MTIPEKAAEIAVSVANDNSIGYSQGSDRWTTARDCSSLCISVYDEAFKEAGIKPTPKDLGATYTGNMRSAFIACGFKAVSYLISGTNLQVGDVLLNEKSHAVIVCSVNPTMVVNARGNLDGKSGDSSGQEIRIQPYWSYPWNCCLRYQGGSGNIPAQSTTSQSSTVGQQMADKIVASRYWPTIKMGAKGVWVKVLQAILIAKGYSVGNDGIDGDYGVMTYSAVNKFQAANSLDRDGIVGPKTWEALKK